MRRLGALILLLGVGLAPGRAHAQTAVAVLGVDPLDASVDVAGRVSTVLRELVTRTSGYRLVPGKALDEIKLVFGCVDEADECMARVGRSLQAGKLLWGTVRRVGRGYQLGLKLLDVPTARVEKFVNEKLTAAEGAQPRRAVERLARALFVPGKGELTVTCAADEAQVTIGTEAVGTCSRERPISQRLLAGTYVVEVTKPGYRTFSQRVVVTGGQSARVEAVLERAEVAGPKVGVPVKPVTPEPEDRRSGWRGAFFTGLAGTVALGVVILVTGLSVLNLQNTKNDIVDNLLLQHSRREITLEQEQKRAFENGDADACGFAGRFDELRQTCDKGGTRATVVNILIGATAASAIVTAIFAYKAFAPRKKARPARTDDDSAAATDRPSAPRWVIAPQLSARGGSLGFLLQF
ncbi:MAG: PEGA domain-containing protein [Deltaproteobacteria bacterium]|nr:PEGA domain-containing protein [Deltaproteobacteria bacterium]